MLQLAEDRGAPWLADPVDVPEEAVWKERGLEIMINLPKKKVTPHCGAKKGLFVLENILINARKSDIIE